jgi:hypothetical protein
MKTLNVTLAAAALALSACAPENPQRMAPPEVYAQGGVQAPVASNVVIKPKVDVLFVIDNSDSMKTHQENLKKNIDRFVEAFEKNARLDFNIGVVQVHDSVRYGKVVEKFHPIGVLYPVKDPQHPGQPVAGPAYVTRAPRYAEVLGETLKIGIIPRFADAAKKIDGGGPEYEEAFTPIIAAIDGRNPGFLRAEAHLAIVMITDADDASSVSPSKLNQTLYDTKGRDRSAYSSYAVLAINGCKTDPGIKETGPERIKEFVQLSKGRVYDLCDKNYGDKLAEVGRMIEKKASRRSKVLLDAIPEEGTLHVFFDKDGDKKFDASKDERVQGWKYDSENVAVVIPGDAMEGRGQADEQVSITYTPIDGRRIGTVRARPVSQGQ